MTDELCKFYVTRKKRFCRMTKKQGYEYCGEHMPLDRKTVDSTKNRRIPCPLDNKHTCFFNKLDKHLKVCNAKQDNLPNYIIKNINSSQESCLQTSKCAKDTSERNLGNVPIPDIKKVIAKITSIYNNQIKDTIKEEILTHDIISKHLSENPDFGATTRKHLLQTSSLLGHLVTAGLASPDSCFIEFGAGKGQLSFWVAQAAAHLENTSVMLVDKASHRHKMDNKLKLEGESERVYRIRADINDLDLSKVEELSSAKKVVGLTKHLCGVATDYALHCLANYDEKSKKVFGLVLAFCCHHRCLWVDYVGKKFVMENEITPEEFDIICGIVSWATSGFGTSREKRKEIAERIDSEVIPKEVERNLELGLSRDEKTTYGQMAKLVLDYGRMEYLKSLNFKCTLCYYTKSEISLENVCIIAVK